MPGDHVVHFADLPEPEPRRFIVEGLIPENFITSIYGDGGTGKSYLAMFMGFCVARGEPFAGRKVEKVNVLYVDAELDQPEQLRRAYALARGVGLSQPPEGFFYVSIGSLTNPVTIAELLNARNEHGFGLIIIDSLTIGSPGIDPNQAKDVIDLLKSLQPLGTVFAIDHVRKPQPGENQRDQRAFGSVFKDHLGRSQMHVIHKNGVLELTHKKANFAAKQEPIFLVLQFENDGLGQDLVRVEFLNNGDRRIASSNLSTRERVFQAVATTGVQGVTLDALTQLLPNLKRRTIQNQLTALKREGRVTQPEIGRWSMPQCDTPQSRESTVAG